MFLPNLDQMFVVYLYDTITTCFNSTLLQTDPILQTPTPHSALLNERQTTTSLARGYSWVKKVTSVSSECAFSGKSFTLIPASRWASASPILASRLTSSVLFMPKDFRYPWKNTGLGVLLATGVAWFLQMQFSGLITELYFFCAQHRAASPR